MKMMSVFLLTVVLAMVAIFGVAHASGETSKTQQPCSSSSLTEDLLSIGETVYRPFKVDYSRGLKEMVKAGDYDWVNKFIDEQNFSLKAKDKINTQIVIVSSNRKMSIDEVLKYMNENNLRPARIEELLAFGIKFSEVQRKFKILALGSSWVQPGITFFPYLGGDADERILDLGYCDGVCSERTHFAALRKQFL